MTLYCPFLLQICDVKNAIGCNPSKTHNKNELNQDYDLIQEHIFSSSSYLPFKVVTVRDSVVAGMIAAAAL